MELDRELILNEFLRESVEQLDVIEQGLLSLEASPGDDALLADVFRAAHSLKGSARMVGLSSLEGSTHSMEEVLEQIKTRVLVVDSELVTILLRLVDSLRRVIPRAVEGYQDQAPQQEHLALTRWLAGERGAQPAAQPVPRPRELGPALTMLGNERSLRVDVSKLDRMIDLIGEITIARGRVTSLLSMRRQRSWEEVRHAHQESDRLMLDLQEQLMRARMVPLGPTFRFYRRVVRDLCLQRGKLAHVVVQGEDVEVDTSVVEGIRDPLTHMLRNAVDHGIEPPDVRRAKGKPEQGTLVLRARHDGGNVEISLSDDGAGIDREAVLERAREQGLIAPHERSDDAELLSCIFEPGFSTARQVSEISGRGMGMDIVRKYIEALRGSISVTSEPGQGTTITLRVPLTLAIIEGFSVSVGPDSYIVPLECVVECLDLPVHERGSRAPYGVIALRGKPLPYVRLSRVFAVDATDGARECVVVVRCNDRYAALVVDALHGTAPTVIKPLADLTRDSEGVSGCAILGNGRVALILDVPALLEQARAHAEASERMNDMSASEAGAAT